jgi:NAD(P)-dependent dehydrogenase (short-subunit alcohol dehydrogenase family)
MSEGNMDTIFITGANRGIGFGLAKHYLQRGATVFAGCRDPQRAEDLHKLGTDRLEIVPLEVTDQAQINAAVQQVRAKTDHLDMLINNAGIYEHPQSDTLQNFNTSDAFHVFEVNTFAPILISRAFLDLLKRGSNPRLIQMSSGAGSLHDKNYSGDLIYGASKAALNILTRGIAVDPAVNGVIVITVNPGWVQTDMTGPYATLTVDQSVTSMIRFFDELTSKHNGGFYEYNGKTHPW